jgi:hypothetical protein
MADERYIVDQRSGCVAVRDTHDPEWENRLPGLGRDYTGVVAYWSGLHHPSGAARWVLSPFDVQEAERLCKYLNENCNQDNLIKGLWEAIDRIGLMCARSPRDWALDHRDAMIWGIANGWDNDGECTNEKGDLYLQIYRDLGRTHPEEWADICRNHRVVVLQAEAHLKEKGLLTK